MDRFLRFCLHHDLHGRNRNRLELAWLENNQEYIRRVLGWPREAGGWGGGFQGYTLRRAGPGALRTVTVGAVVPLQPYAIYTLVSRLGDGLISDPRVGTGQLPTAKPLSHVPHRSTLPLPHTEGHCSDKGELGRGPGAHPQDPRSRWVRVVERCGPQRESGGGTWA